MTRKYGVSSTGLIAPIIRKGDDLAKIVTDVVLNAIDNIEDGDVIGITESIVARAEGNYVTIDEVAEDIKKVMKNPKCINLKYPIYSRNRFAMILKAFARAAKDEVNIYMPVIDEVGNVLINHPFTKINYNDYYKSIVEAEGKKCSIFDKCLLEDNYVDCGLHPEDYDFDIDKDNIYTLIDFCKDKCEYGLLGSNKASEEKLKLFPSKKYSQKLVEQIRRNIIGARGKIVHVFVFGDGCYKDPDSGIFEFADPVTSPAYTKGLNGTPNELKLKALADDKFKDLNGEELSNAIKNEIMNKETNLVGKMCSQGTTPRRYINLLASLADLTVASGEKGTPIVYIKNYFKNYADE